MIIKEKIQIETSVTKDIICNRCGETTNGELCPANFQYASLKAEWGYGSRKDWETHTAHICEKCYDTITSEFKIPPEVIF